MIINASSYQPGGTNYKVLAARYGIPAADKLSQLAREGDPVALNLYLSDLARGATDADYDTRGTLEIFFDQVTGDPLAAPLEAANRQIGNAVWNVFKNPFVLLAVAGLIVWQFGLLNKFLKR